MTSTPRPKVLIVDDRPDNLLALEAILEPLPCEVVRAGSGEEALRRLLHEEVAVILLDVQMPGLDGYETARAVKGRGRTRSIPIIFLTAVDGDIHQQLRGYGTGAVDFLAKPLQPEVLVAKVSVFLDLSEQRALVAAQAAELARRLDERNAAKAALSRLTAELQRSNVELERFAMAVSHDLREPLQVGAGLLDLLDARYADCAQPEARDLLNEARRGLQELDGLVAGLLERTRPQVAAQERNPVDLGEVLAEARMQLAAELELVGAVLTADPLPTVTGDRWSLQQLFVHVLQSALRRVEDGAHVHIGVARRYDRWVVSVTDDGRPIDVTQLPRIFSMFGRPGDPDAADAGLAIARRIVQEHGGAIWVEPAPGRGTTVSFGLATDAAIDPAAGGPA
jgi:hypothetical protein